ncbi:MAG: gamma-glutamyltransferase [Gammaproteobacteria bacterium]|nr:gamma-glutamyltransferase [Gammaproteobacteria bacterium]
MLRHYRIRFTVAAVGVTIALALWLAPVALADKPPHAAIATAHPEATAAGHEILALGGNAFDAAVAITAVIGVVEPYGSGLGGGGFWLLHRQSDGYQTLLDGREKAPAAAHRDMYLDAEGNVIDGAAINGPLAAGIPGVPAAMVHLAKNYGRLPLQKSLAPAIRVASNGFAVDEQYRRYATMRLKTLQQYPATAEIFLENGAVPPLGHRLRQPDLARTLETIAQQGNAGFYQGTMARRIVAGVKQAGGLWSLADLENYRVIEREPIRVDYQGMTLISAPLPSSGGIVLAGILNMLSQYDVATMDRVDRTHVTLEAMRRAYRDRAEYLGDSDFVEVPVARLLSREHSRQLVRDLQLDRATPSEELAPVGDPGGAGADTTHFSVLDKDGNRVAATLSVNYLFGSCYVVPGTGFLLNDEMDDFSAKPGVPNAYGLVGAEANAIAPGKRPLSSMSPTFIENDRGVALLGTPGGSRIITMVLLGALEYDKGGDAPDIVKRPRFHHQYLPDLVMYENEAFDAELEQELALRGHVLKKQMSPYGGGFGHYGNMQAVVWDKSRNTVSAASDPRGIGAATLK